MNFLIALSTAALALYSKTPAKTLPPFANAAQVIVSASDVHNQARACPKINPHQPADCAHQKAAFMQLQAHEIPAVRVPV